MSKSLLIAIVCSVLLIACSAEKRQYKEDLMLKAVRRNYAMVIPGLYAQKTEVTNRQYNEFLTYLEKKDPLLRKVHSIDTAGWRAPGSNMEGFVVYYHTHVAYYNHPVVNVSWNSAEAYCQWLTELYQQQKVKRFPKGYFRLPKRSEWQMAARGKDSAALYPWEGMDMRNKKGQFRANFSRVNQAMVIDGDTASFTGGFGHGTGMFTAPAISYWPNSYGIYNMAGNVSEWLAEPGETAGGNWRSTGYYLLIDAKDEFHQELSSASQIGFRVFFDTGEREVK